MQSHTFNILLKQLSISLHFGIDVRRSNGWLLLFVTENDSHLESNAKHTNTLEFVEIIYLLFCALKMVNQYIPLIHVVMLGFGTFMYIDVDLSCESLRAKWYLHSLNAMWISVAMDLYWFYGLSVLVFGCCCWCCSVLNSCFGNCSDLLNKVKCLKCVEYIDHVHMWVVLWCALIYLVDNKSSEKPFLPWIWAHD